MVLSDSVLIAKGSHRIMDKSLERTSPQVNEQPSILSLSGVPVSLKGWVTGWNAGPQGPDPRTGPRELPSQ
jgi:hypothetical protein